MGKTVLAITLGGHDLLLDNCTFKEIKRSTNLDFPKEVFYQDSLMPRQGGEYILKRWDHFAPRLDCPMVKKGVDYVIEAHQHIDRLILICTDQNANIPEQLRNNDTVFFAEIIRKIILQAQKNKCHKPIKGNIAIISISDKVGHLDQMYSLFRSMYKNNKHLKDLSQSDRFYCLPIGGIPSINTAFLVSSIIQMREACEQIYLCKEREIAIPISFGRELIKEIEREKVNHFLSNYDYYSLENMFSTNEKVKLLATFAKHLLFFNIESAKLVARDLLKMKGDCNERELFERFLYEATENTKMSKKIELLFLSSKHKYLQGQYVDFLGRIFRLSESVYRYIAEEHLNLKTDEKKFKEFNNAIASFPNLRDYLRMQLINGAKLDWKKPNRIVLKCITTYILSVNKNLSDQPILSNEEKEILSDVYNCLIKIDSLAQMRNNCLLGHGFEGVSKKKIEDAVGNIDHFIEKVEEIILKKYMGIDLDKNIFNDVNEYIRRMIK